MDVSITSRWATANAIFKQYTLRRLAKSVPRSLCRLQWKLTLSYALVTILAICVVGIVALAVIYAMPPRDEMYTSLLSQSLGNSAYDIAPYMRGTLSDRELIADWLDGVVRGSEIRLAPAGRNRFTFVGKPLVAVVDEKGLVLASNSSLGAPASTFLIPRLKPEPATLLQEALTRPVSSARFLSTSQDGLIVVTAPVLGSKERVEGAVFLAFLRPLGINAFLMDLWGNVQRYLVLVLAFAGSVGALFGYSTARGLSSRLFAVADTASAWGRGDFSRTIHDSMRDEIGHLGRQLNDMMVELQDLLRDREQLAALEERNRLARDLHDSVTQAMYAITLYSEAASRLLAVGNLELVDNYLGELQKTSQEALREMRLLIFELRPPVLQNQGLVAALQARLEAVEARADIHTAIEVDGTLCLRPAIEEALYQIAREALNNTFKHAQATDIQIRLRQDTQTICMEVWDDGMGFDVESAREHRGMGLCSIEERVAKIRGELTIVSRPGNGTSVKVEIGL